MSILGIKTVTFNQAQLLDLFMNGNTITHGDGLFYVHYPAAGVLRCLLAGAAAPLRAVMLNRSEAEAPYSSSSCLEPEALSEEEELLPSEGGELCTLRAFRQPAEHR